MIFFKSCLRLKLFSPLKQSSSFRSVFNLLCKYSFDLSNSLESFSMICFDYSLLHQYLIKYLFQNLFHFMKRYIKMFIFSNMYVPIFENEKVYWTLNNNQSINQSKMFVAKVYSLMLLAQRRSSKYQFYSLWFQPPGLEHTIYRTRSDHAHLYTTHGVVNY